MGINYENFERKPESLQGLTDLIARFEETWAAYSKAFDALHVADQELRLVQPDPDWVLPRDHPATIEARDASRRMRVASDTLRDGIHRRASSGALLGNVLYQVVQGPCPYERHESQWVQRIDLNLESNDVIFLDPLPE